MKTKKRFLIIAVLLGLGILFFIPVVPQSVPTEVSTQEGGYMSISYKLYSINEIIQNPERHFSWFPHNEQTKKYNITSLAIAIGIIMLIGLFLLRLIKRIKT